MRVLHSAGLAASRHDSFAHGFGDWWCRDAQHLNEELLMNKLEGGDKEIFFIMHEIDSFLRASTTRVRCLDRASRSFAWTTSAFHGPRGEVPARHKQSSEERA